MSLYSSKKNLLPAGLIISVTLIIEISTGINYILFPMAIKELVDNNSLIGIAMSCEILSLIFFCSLINRILQYMGLKRAIIITCLLRSMLLYYVQYINSYAMWIIVIFLYGFVSNILRLSLQTWLNLLSFRKFKGLVLGFFSSALSLGVALGPVVLNQIGLGRGLQMKTNSVISFSVLFIICFALKSAPVVNIKNKNRFIFVVKNASIVMLSALVGGIVFFGLPGFLTLYGIKSGLKESDASLLLSSFMLGSVFLGIIISYLSGIIKKKYIIIFCIFNSLICAVLLPITIYNYNLSLLLLFIWGGNAGGMFTVGLSVIGDKFRQEDQVSANMAYSIMDSYGGLIGLCLIGFAMDLIGSEGLTYIIVASSISFFLYVLFKSEFK